MAAFTDDTKMGLSNRFFVKMENGIDLGSWSKCEGLDVSWALCDYRAGDQGNERYYYPGNTSYSMIRLTRAASADSQKVKDALSANSFGSKPTTGNIELRDAENLRIVGWDLEKVVITKWSITSFDSGASTVALETLELVHNGFLEDGSQ